MTSSKPIPLSAIVSICTSVLSTSFSSSTLTFELDTSPSNRAISPFYGIFAVSISRRFIGLVTMFLFTFCSVAAKAYAIALLLTSSHPEYVGFYFAIDYAFFFCYKAARRELLYWMNIRGVFGWVISFIIRVLVKAMADFTACCHLRHVYELGGLYWTLNLILSHSANLIISYFFGSLHFSGALFAGFLVFFSTFLLSIRRAKLGSFFDSRTASDYTVENFQSRDINDDQGRVDVLDTRVELWRKIEPEVRNWVMSRWTIWESTKPSWFTKSMQRKILDGHPDYVPDYASVRKQHSGIPPTHVAGSTPPFSGVDAEHSCHQQQVADPSSNHQEDAGTEHDADESSLNVMLDVDWFAPFLRHCVQPPTPVFRPPQHGPGFTHAMTRKITSFVPLFRKTTVSPSPLLRTTLPIDIGPNGLPAVSVAVAKEMGGAFAALCKGADPAKVVSVFKNEHELGRELCKIVPELEELLLVIAQVKFSRRSLSDKLSAMFGSSNSS